MVIGECTALATDCDGCVVVTNRASRYAMLADCFGLQSMPESDRGWCMASAINCDDVPAIGSRGPG